MSQLPPIHGHFESPYRHIKIIQKLETITFPTCHSVTVEWNLGNIFHPRKRLVMIHHDFTCKWSVSAVVAEGEQLKLEKLDF
jgi:hypothetical protein